MTADQQRIAIAEFCGLRWNRNPTDDREVLMVLPDYLNDLNAMHKAESKLLSESQNQPTDALWVSYRTNLERLAGACLSFHASASHRAEALLLTIQNGL